MSEVTVERRAHSMAESQKKMMAMFAVSGSRFEPYRPEPTDTIITPFGKCGTTWLQQMFHTLRTGGDTDYVDISRVVPWMESVVRGSNYRDHQMMPTAPAADAIDTVLRVHPPHDLPEGLEKLVQTRASTGLTQVPRRTPMESHLIRVDLNSDGDADYVLVSANRHDPYTQTATLFTRVQGEWRGYGMQINGDYAVREQITNALEAGNMGAVEHRWQLFRVGEATLSVMENMPPIDPLSRVEPDFVPLR